MKDTNQTMNSNDSKITFDDESSLSFTGTQKQLSLHVLHATHNLVFFFHFSKLMRAIQIRLDQVKALIIKSIVPGFFDFFIKNLLIKHDSFATQWLSFHGCLCYYGFLLAGCTRTFKNRWDFVI